MGVAEPGWRLQAGDEWVSRDAFGNTKPADVAASGTPPRQGRTVALCAPRNGYASLRLWVAGSGEYRLALELDGRVEADLFRAWYHRLAEPHGGGQPAYWVDALVPVAWSSPQQLPDPDNAVPGQTHQEFWVDLFVPGDAPVGPAAGRIVLEWAGGRAALEVALQVLPVTVPPEPTLTCDHNSYGRGPFASLYPRAFAGCRDEDQRTRKTIEILHHYYRLCHEHRGLFSNLGAGHDGSCDRIYAPCVRGQGRTRGLEEWAWFDQHYGPLLDGSALATPSPGMPPPRRPARPLWGVYTPVTPSWPADYLWWGQPGYEVEFTRCLGQFDQHLRERGWVHTRPYFFFNHKKRYRWYEWDGDEPKYGLDDGYVLEMGRLYRAAVGGSPVPWVYRMDASWRMQDHFERFAGLVDFWVCGGFAQWYPEEIGRLVERGDTVWTYSGTAGIQSASAALLENVLRPWARGLQGHCEWLTIDPGQDPWFACDGAATGMLYPGDRFGLAGPLPSIRLKL
ncbi:MAG: hypothetical protein AB1505_32005, partial [Candidatus Latescibacterota bacterium]